MLSSLFFLRGPYQVPSDVSVVRLDSRSYLRLGLTRNTGLPYSLLAEAIERICKAQPKLVVLDLFLSQESAEPKENERLMAALRSCRTVLGSSATAYIDTDVEGKQTLDFERYYPAGGFKRSASQVTSMLVAVTQKTVQHLSVTNEHDALPLERIPLLKPLRAFVSSKLKTPEHEAFINYYGGPYSIPGIPIYKLLNEPPSVSSEYFRNRVVFVGAVDLPNSNPDGHDDSFTVPVSSAPMWGVEIHAHIAQNLLDGSWIRAMSRHTAHAVFNSLIVVLVFLFLKGGLSRAFLLWASATFLWAATAYVLFVHCLFFLQGAGVFLVVLPAFLVVLSLKEAWLRQCRKRRAASRRSPRGRRKS
jgi:CHASE2 domain-containing sensor protein